MKDNFSTQSDLYLKFRPTYPQDLFEFLNTVVRSHGTALDCATGNGQLAIGLSPYFNQVIATDISETQLKEARPADNIIYKLEEAEHTSFSENSFDLITVAQAIHWFDFTAFYAEVQRIIKTGGILAVVGYGLIHVNAVVDKVIAKLYSEILGPYWDKERKYIDQHYKTIPFPFEELLAPDFINEYEWTFEQLIGYLQTWSAVKHYTGQHQENPVDILRAELWEAWKEDDIKKVSFPLLIRIARVYKKETS